MWLVCNCFKDNAHDRYHRMRPYLVSPWWASFMHIFLLFICSLGFSSTINRRVYTSPMHTLFVILLIFVYFSSSGFLFLWACLLALSSSILFENLMLYNVSLHNILWRSLYEEWSSCFRKSIFIVFSALFYYNYKDLWLMAWMLTTTTHRTIQMVFPQLKPSLQNHFWMFW